MASCSDSTLAFFTKATPPQWSYVFSQYREALKTKAARRTKKGGPDELIRMDAWYQEQLPTLIHSRKDPHITHDELLQITKWKLMRGRYRPNLTDLIRINTEKAVILNSKKAFQRLPNLSSAIGALTCLKGVGPATASAILAAGYPQHAPFMADECMISTPGVETMDYTVAEYMNYSMQLKEKAEHLNKLDSTAEWDPHKIELALWAHFILGELNCEVLANLPQNDNTRKGSNSDEDSLDANTVASQNENKPEGQDEDSGNSLDNQSSHDGISTGESDSESNFGKNGSAEPPAKRSRK